MVHSPSLYTRLCKSCQAWFFFLHREPQMECTSSRGTALGPDEAIVEFDQVLANGEPKAQATRLAGQKGIHTVEAIKNPLQVLRRNTYTMIAHTDFHHVSWYVG